jgi:beta-galactosidase
MENGKRIIEIDGVKLEVDLREATVIDHYKAFWQLGIPVDLIDSTRDFDGYSVLVAPMLYLLRNGTPEAIEAFVKRGGTFVATYATGYVNETDLTFLGGFPGPLMGTLGVWAEEIDALYPEDRNAIVWNNRSYEAFELCELIHTRGAETLGTYGNDFYAGRPALTRNRCGKGAAYFIAARTGGDFLMDFYQALTRECDVVPVLEKPLPTGVTAQVRSDGVTDYVFVMNATPNQVALDAGQLGKKELAPYETWIVERAQK